MWRHSTFEKERNTKTNIFDSNSVSILNQRRHVYKYRLSSVFSRVFELNNRTIWNRTIYSVCKCLRSWKHVHDALHWHLYIFQSVLLSFIVVLLHRQENVLLVDFWCCQNKDPCSHQKQRKEEIWNTGDATAASMLSQFSVTSLPIQILINFVFCFEWLCATPVSILTEWMT